MCKEKEYAQVLLDANAIAILRGDRFGLCDCIDSKGNPYPSQWLHDLLKEARDLLKLTPMVGSKTFGHVKINQKWSTASQWEKR